MDADVIVIGAGLAGLQSARRLQRDGHRAIVLEAEEAVGGRIRTDVVDGFRCDRGFQVLNPAYPAVRSWIDLAALDLQRFGVGAAIRDTAGIRTLAHPLRHPRHALETLASSRLTAAELTGLARWIGPTLLRATAASRATTDTTLHDSFDRVGLTGPLRRDVLDTFLAGVLADSSGTASANYVRLLVRSFALGVPGLPSAGMQALPEQMATSLHDPVRLATPARAVRERRGGVEVTTDSGVLRARAVLVAVDPHRIGELTDQPAPATHGLTTWWFSAPHCPRRGRFLVLDASRPGGGPAGPVWNTAVVSEVAPTYAPAGRHLVQATTLLDRPDGRADEHAVRRDLERIYGVSTAGWEVLVHHVIPHTLPAQPPPLVDRRRQRIGEATWLVGDHRDTASIQGALVSGDRAARGLHGLLAA